MTNPGSKSCLTNPIEIIDKMSLRTCGLNDHQWDILASAVCFVMYVYATCLFCAGATIFVNQIQTLTVLVPSSSI